MKNGSIVQMLVSKLPTAVEKTRNQELMNVSKIAPKEPHERREEHIRLSSVSIVARNAVLIPVLVAIVSIVRMPASKLHIDNASCYPPKVLLRSWRNSKTMKRVSKAQIMRSWNLTQSDLQAIDYVGRHRKTHVYPHRKSCPLSVRTMNKLIKRGYFMPIDDVIDWAMLTYQGEKVFTALYPYSKWRIQ